MVLVPPCLEILLKGWGRNALLNLPAGKIANFAVTDAIVRRFFDLVAVITRAPL